MEKFSKLKYTRPDMKEYKVKFETLLCRFKSAADYQEARKCFFDFQALSSKLDTISTIAFIRNTLDTTDSFYDNAIEFINSENTKLSIIIKEFNRAMLISPFRSDFEGDIGIQYFKLIEADERTVDNAVVTDLIKEDRVSVEYKKTAASCQVVFRNENCNLYGLLKHMQSTDRVERKEAFEAWVNLYEGISTDLDHQYTKLCGIRRKTASKLGFKSYVEMIYTASHHFDYTPDDIAAFREEIRKYVVPAAAKLYEAQRVRLGVNKLHYYDEQLLFPEGNAVPEGTKDEMVAEASEMYHELSKETGDFFDFMTKHELFDLDTRPGKHLGGYCTQLCDYNAPFIFSNFNGTSADVDVLTHEAGHAFEFYEASKTQPLNDYTYSSSDINEIHSMSMELFCYPWMKNFFGSEKNAAKYRFGHLSETVKTLPYLAAVDEFQHRVFEHNSTTPKMRRKIWREIEKKYLPWRDYDGNEFLESGGFWMQKQHIFIHPFYYIDYALSQFGAYDFFIKAKQNRKEAWYSYLKFCRTGGSLGYRELLSSASLSDPFIPGNVKYLTDAVMNEIENEEVKFL